MLPSLFSRAFALRCLRVLGVSALMSHGHSLTAQTPPARTPLPPRDTQSSEDVTAYFTQVDVELLDERRTDDSEAAALLAGQRHIRRGLNRLDPSVAAIQLYRTMDLASRLEAKQRLLTEAADSAYAYRLVDAQPASSAMFLLSLGTLELTRGDYATTKLYVDSAVVAYGGVLTDENSSSALLIRGYAHEGLNQFEAAHADFIASAERYAGLPTIAQRAPELSAVEAAAGTAIQMSDYGEALRLSTWALRLLFDHERHFEALPSEAYMLYLSHAEALALNGRYEEGFRYGQLALKLAEDRQDRHRIASANWKLGQTHHHAGDDARAAVYLERAVASMKAYRYRRDQEEALEDLIEVKRVQGRFEEAFTLQSERLLLTDSLREESQAAKITELREEHEYRRAQHGLVLARAEGVIKTQEAVQSRTRSWVLGCSALALAILLALATVLLRRRTRDKAGLERVVAERTSDLSAQAAELTEQAKDLKRSNTELERFAYIASHDLKTPVRNIVSFVQLARRRVKRQGDPEAVEYLNLAHTYALQLSSLVSGILEFSRIDSDTAGPNETVALSGAVDSFRRQCAADPKLSHCRIVCTGQADIEAPGACVNQIISNLIGNGLKYNASLVPRVAVTIERVTEERIQISFADNGIGIDAAYQEQVFGLFKRLHTIDQYEGMGLGLAVCKKVIERLGGSIRLHSVTGEGSTFTVELPTDARADVGEPPSLTRVDLEQ